MIGVFVVKASISSCHALPHFTGTVYGMLNVFAHVQGGDEML